MNVADKSALKTFIDANKLAYYNKSPQGPPHILHFYPLVSTSLILALVVFAWNAARNKLQIAGTIPKDLNLVQFRENIVK